MDDLYGLRMRLGRLFVDSIEFHQKQLAESGQDPNGNWGYWHRALHDDVDAIVGRIPVFQSIPLPHRALDRVLDSELGRQLPHSRLAFAYELATKLFDGMA